MRITKRQLRRIIRESAMVSLRPFSEGFSDIDIGVGGSDLTGRDARPDGGPFVEFIETPGAWANEHRGDVDRDEEGQTIIYLSKEDYPSGRDVLGLLPPGWDYEDTYDGTSWVVYTNEYPAGSAR